MVKCWSNPWRAPVPWRRRSNPIGHFVRPVQMNRTGVGCFLAIPTTAARDRSPPGALWINVGGIPGGRQSLGAVEAIRLGLCQAGSNEPHWRWVLSSDSNDGCEGPQPSRRAMIKVGRIPGGRQKHSVIFYLIFVISSILLRLHAH